MKKNVKLIVTLLVLFVCASTVIWAGGSQEGMSKTKGGRGRISVSKDTFKYGRFGETEVTGKGFTSGSSVTLMLDNQPVGTVTADENGEFSTIISIPELDAGEYEIETDPLSDEAEIIIVPIKIGVILPGSVTDASYNAAAYLAMEEIAKSPNIETMVTTGAGEVGIEAELRSYAREADMVLAWTVTYTPDVNAVAPEFPDTWFICTDMWEVTEDPNAKIVNLWVSKSFVDGAYLCGMAAGGATQTNKVGFTGAVAIGTGYTIAEAYRLGAERVNPDITAYKGWSGDWWDPSKGADVASTLISAGCDVVMARGGIVAVGAMQGVGKAFSQGKKVWGIGDMTDMYSLNPKIMLTSNVIKVDVWMRKVVDLWIDDALETKAYWWGLKEDCVEIAPFYDHEDAVPETVKREIATVINEVKSGQFEIPYLITEEELKEAEKEWGSAKN